LLAFYHLGDFDMRWRDIRFEKPTEADADNHGRVLQLLDNGDVGVYHLESKYRTIAWMPMSELPAFDRIPDPPEGWRFVEKGEAFDKRAKFWFSRRWENTHNLAVFDPHSVYIVPIDPPKPPEPQYRPFANAAEFEPHKNKWWRYKSADSDEQIPPALFNDKIHGVQYWQDSFENKVFSDGSPFGVKVEP
jgi:hypothetical protein